MATTSSRLAADLCRSRIEEMIEAGQSFAAVEQRIASSGLPDEERAELWQFGWRIWSARLRHLHSTERPRRFTRLAARASAARRR